MYFKTSPDNSVLEKIHNIEELFLLNGQKDILQLDVKAIEIITESNQEFEWLKKSGDLKMLDWAEGISGSIVPFDIWVEANDDITLTDFTLESKHEDYYFPCYTYTKQDEYYLFEGSLKEKLWTLKLRVHVVKPGRVTVDDGAPAEDIIASLRHKEYSKAGSASHAAPREPGNDGGAHAFAGSSDHPYDFLMAHQGHVL